MLTFLLYTIGVITLGILIRIFWLPLLIIGAIIFIALGITASAAITAFIFTLIHALFTEGEWSGFTTYFTYLLVFFTVASIVYGAIVGDIFNYAENYLKYLFKKP